MWYIVAFFAFAFLGFGIWCLYMYIQNTQNIQNTENNEQISYIIGVVGSLILTVIGFFVAYKLYKQKNVNMSQEENIQSIRIVNKPSMSIPKRSISIVDTETGCDNNKRPEWLKRDRKGDHVIFYLQNYYVQNLRNCQYIKYNFRTRTYCCSNTPATEKEMADFVIMLIESRRHRTLFTGMRYELTTENLKTYLESFIKDLSSEEQQKYRDEFNEYAGHAQTYLEESIAPKTYQNLKDVEEEQELEAEIRREQQKKYENSSNRYDQWRFHMPPEIIRDWPFLSVQSKRKHVLALNTKLWNQMYDDKPSTHRD